MADPKPDTRPTVDFGTRYGQSAAEKSRAAKQLAAGQARADAEAKASAYRRAMKKGKSREGYAAETRRKRLNPSPLKIGPQATQYKYTVE